MKKKKASPIQPLDGWIVVEPIDNDEIKTATGLVISTTNAEKEQRKNIGLVIGVPKDSPVSEGCTIYYKPYAGQDAWVNEKRYLMVELQDVCGVLKD